MGGRLPKALLSDSYALSTWRTVLLSPALEKAVLSLGPWEAKGLEF